MLMRRAAPATIRWMIKRDLPAVLWIESQAFRAPWTEFEFVTVLRCRHNIGMVTEIEDRIVGYMVYGIHENHLRVFNFAVATQRWRTGVGRKMVERLQSKLSPRRNKLLVNVPETNLPAQLFFKACGFRCTKILHDLYDDIDEPAYAMEYRHEV